MRNQREGARVQVEPVGPSSIVMPAAARASRIWSAFAKSLFYGLRRGRRAARRRVRRVFERAGVAAGLVAAVNPRTGKRVETERVEHRAHIDERGTQCGAVRVVGVAREARKQCVALANLREDRCGGARHIHVVVHGGDEIHGQIVGRDAGDLVTRRLLTERAAAMPDERS